MRNTKKRQKKDMQKKIQKQKKGMRIMQLN